MLAATLSHGTRIHEGRGLPVRGLYVVGLGERFLSRFPVGRNFQCYVAIETQALELQAIQVFGNRRQIVEQGLRVRVKADEDESAQVPQAYSGSLSDSSLRRP